MIKMALKKALLVLLALSVMTVCLAGCGDSASGSEATGDTNAPESSADTGEKEVIKFAHQFTDGEGAAVYMTDSYKWVTEAAALFESRNENFVVELEYIDGADYSTKLTTDYLAGIVHDVIMVQNTEVAQNYAAGSLLDIQPYFSQWDEAEQADFNWNPVWNSFEIDGGLYGLPCGLHTRTVAYRKDLFEAAGLDPESPPATLEEMVEYAQILTNEENDVWGLGLYLGPHPASCEVVMQPLIWSMGGNYYDEANGLATFTDQAVIDSIQWMYDCVYEYEITPTWTMEGEQDESLLTPFINGQFAMAFGIGNYWLSDLQNAGLIDGVYPASAEVDDSKVGWFVIPDENGKTFANSWGLGVAANTSNPEAAFELLTCAADKEVIKNFISYGGFPGRLSGFDDPAYSGDYWQNWFDIANTGTTITTQHYHTVQDSLTAAMQEIITSKDDSNISEVLTQYETEYNNRYGGTQ